LKSFAETRVTLTELASAAGMTEGAVRYRVRRGQLSAPDREGLFDRRRALDELGRRPKQRGGRKRAPIKAAMKMTAAERDAIDRYKLAKAKIAEINLRKMRGELMDIDDVKRRSFAFFRMVRDRMLAWPARAAPEIAARITWTKARSGER
jgi:hypothetical protein